MTAPIVTERRVKFAWWLVAIFSVTGLSAVIASFFFLTGLAIEVGWPVWQAPLLPLSIDALGAASLMLYLTDPRDKIRRSAKRTAWLAVSMSILGNASAHLMSTGLLRPGWVAVTIVGAVPPLALFLVVHHAGVGHAGPSGPPGLTWIAARALVLEGDPLCAYCGKLPATSVDHVIPRSRGGAETDLRNLVPACQPCNSEKADRTLAEWMDARRDQGLPLQPRTRKVTGHASEPVKPRPVRKRAVGGPTDDQIVESARAKGLLGRSELMREFGIGAGRASRLREVIIAPPVGKSVSNGAGANGQSQLVGPPSV